MCKPCLSTWLVGGASITEVWRPFEYIIHPSSELQLRRGGFSDSMQSLRRLRIAGVLALVTASMVIRHSQQAVSVKVTRDVSAVLASTVKLNCTLTTDERMTQLTWQKKRTPNNENLLTYRLNEKPTYLTPFAKERITFEGGGDIGNISIRDVTLSDEGTYLCSFSTHPSGTREEEIILHVHVPPTVSMDLPQTVSQTSPKNVAECTAAAAKPPATITWSSNGFAHTFNMTEIVHDNGTVTRRSQLWMVPSLSLSGQNMSCVVSQAMTAFRQQVNFTLVNILYAPQDVTIDVKRGDDGKLQLECAASANPPVNYTWRRETANLPDGESLQLSQTLIVSRRETNGLDLYICESQNSVGGESRGIYVYVTIENHGRSSYGVLTVLFLVLLLLCVGLVIAWKKGMIEKGRYFDNVDSQQKPEAFKERPYSRVALASVQESPQGSETSNEENKYDDIPLEAERCQPDAEKTRNRTYGHKSLETKQRSPQTSENARAMEKSVVKAELHLDTGQDQREVDHCK